MSGRTNGCPGIMNSGLNSSGRGIFESCILPGSPRCVPPRPLNENRIREPGIRSTFITRLSLDLFPSWLSFNLCIRLMKRHFSLRSDIAINRR